MKLNIECKGEELRRHLQALEKAEQERRTIVEGFSTIRQKIQKARSRIEQLLQEKNGLEDILKLREHQLQLQKDSATQEKEWHQRHISLQEREISGLKIKLMEVEHELEKTQPQLLSLRKELQDVMLKLSKQSSELQNLQEVKERMKLELKMNRKEFDSHLIHQAGTSSSEHEVSIDIELYITTNVCNVGVILQLHNSNRSRKEHK